MTLRIGSLAIALGAMAAAPTGCGSTTTSDTTPHVDASMTEQPESGPDVAPGSTGAGGSRPDTGTACIPIGVSVATVDAGPLWSCFQQACALSLAICARDCLCNNGIAGALACIGAGGAQTTCFLTAATTLGTNPAALALLGCLTTAQACIRGDAGPGGGMLDAVSAMDVGSGADSGGSADVSSGGGNTDVGSDAAAPASDAEPASDVRAADSTSDDARQPSEAGAD